MAELSQLLALQAVDVNAVHRLAIAVIGIAGNEHFPKITGDQDLVFVLRILADDRCTQRIVLG